MERSQALTGGVSSNVGPDEIPRSVALHQAVERRCRRGGGYTASNGAGLHRKRISDAVFEEFQEIAGADAPGVLLNEVRTNSPLHGSVCVGVWNSQTAGERGVGPADRRESMDGQDDDDVLWAEGDVSRGHSLFQNREYSLFYALASHQ
jgi:hypothetical protein